jgi:hypothetical protein
MANRIIKLERLSIAQDKIIRSLKRHA